jgi:hypothetical protein
MRRIHGTLTGLILIVALAVPFPTVSQRLTEPTAPLSPLSITFTGPEESVLTVGQWGMFGTPDGALSMRNDGSTTHLWLTANIAAFYLRGPSLTQLTPHQLSGGQAMSVLSPSGSGFDADYAGPGAVIRDANSSDLLMFYHGEHHGPGQSCPGQATIGIGLARSSNGGVTWIRQGQIISGRTSSPLCSKFQGAGYPSVVVRGAYIYLYYVDWIADGVPDTVRKVDEVHVARAPIESDGAPGAWRKYDGAIFGTPGIGGSSESVIRRTSDDTSFAGNPNISYNVALGRYIAILTDVYGFSVASSLDGLSWDLPRSFFSFPGRMDQRQPGDIWYDYASFLSPSQPDQTTTTRTGYLYYAKGRWQEPSHTLMRRPLRIDFRVLLPLILRQSPAPPISCQSFSEGTERTVAPGTIVLGDVQLDGVAQYDQGIGEGTMVFTERDAVILAPWGASCVIGSANDLPALRAQSFSTGCTIGCRVVRQVENPTIGAPLVRCYYPNGTTQSIIVDAQGSHCP